ncbi:MAG: HAMP domain-containing sensor histidine kinase [Pirellulales bacterium]
MRILVVILAVTALGLLSAGVVAFALQRSRILAAIDDELGQEFSTVKALVDGLSPNDAQDGEAVETEQATFATTDALVYETVRVVTPPLSGGTIGIIDGQARFIPGVNMSLRLESPAFLDEIANATASGQTVIDTFSLDGREVRYLAIPMYVDGSDSHGVFVAAIDVYARLVDLRSTVAVYTWVAVGVVGLVGLVGWFVAGRLLEPLRQLQRTASRISVGALDERIPVTGNDDLSELTETINAMIARLEDSFIGQQRVVNDVRHELATPVTIIRGYVDMLDPTDPDDVRQNLAVVSDELDRMSALIAQIACLADAERTSAHLPRWIDLDELTLAVFDKARVIGDHDWQLRSGSGRIFADPSQITQAWLQLADNAAKYSLPGTPIEIGSALDSNQVRCWVADSGRGIPASARSRIFERFGRAESSRGTAGSGLGLPIVQALVKAHRGTIDLQTELGRGSTFTMVLPRDPAAPDGRPGTRGASDE